MNKFLGKVGAYLSGVAGRAKLVIFAALCIVGFSSFATGTDVSSFVSQDSTSGAVTVDSSVITTYLKQIVVAAYGNWITLVIIFVVIGLVCWILFKKH